MSLRHLAADRVSSAGDPRGQPPSSSFINQASPPVLPPASQYGSMPEVPPSNVVVRVAHAAQYSKGSLLVTKHGLLSSGTLILALLCFLPCWDAVQMLRNLNFVQWIGPTLPVCVFVLSAFLVVFFVLMAENAFNQRYPVTMQTVALTCSLFVTIAGLLLIVASLPLSHGTVQVANELAYDCAGYRARDIAIANQQLAALRATPACAVMPSIEDCEGYTESPEAVYLKYMELNFRCSGFCVRPGAAAVPPAAEAAAIAASAAGDAPAAVAEEESAPVAEEAAPAAEEAAPAAEAPPASVGGGADDADAAGLITLNTKLLRTIAESKEVVMPAADVRLWQPLAAPPTLFTAANFQTTCDGAASRDLLNFGRELGWQFWYTGIILITVAIFMGIFEWKGGAIA